VDPNNQENQELHEPTSEERAQAEQQANDDLTAGFNRIKGGGEPIGVGAGDGQGDTDAGAAPEQSGATNAGKQQAGAAAEPAAPANDPWEGVPDVVRQKFDTLEGAFGRLRNIEGHIGGLNSKIDQALSRAQVRTERGGGDSPSAAQISAALKDPDAWKNLMEEFPDFAGPVEAELKDIRTALAALSSQSSPAHQGLSADDVARIADERFEARRVQDAHETIEEKHAGWQTTVATKEFATWLEDQPKATRDLAASPRAKDAIKLLDTFKARNESANQTAEEERARREKEEAARRRRQTRLETAVTPKGGAQVAGQSGMSDDEALEYGFRRVQNGEA